MDKKTKEYGYIRLIPVDSAGMPKQKVREIKRKRSRLKLTMKSRRARKRYFKELSTK